MKLFVTPLGYIEVHEMFYDCGRGYETLHNDVTELHGQEFSYSAGVSDS